MSMYRVRVVFAGAPITGAASSTLYFDDAGGTAQQAATAAMTWWAAAKVVMRTDCTFYNEVEVATIDAGTGDMTAISSVTQTVITGTNDTTPSAAQVQGVMRLRTGQFYNGREVRGRIYIPALGQGAFNNTGWQSGYLGTLNTAGAALISDANSTLVIWHRPTWDEGTPHTEAPDHPGISKVVSSASLWTKTGVLRSRRD